MERGLYLQGEQLHPSAGGGGGATDDPGDALVRRDAVDAGEQLPGLREEHDREPGGECAVAPPGQELRRGETERVGPAD